MSDLPWFVTVDLGDLIGCSLAIGVSFFFVLAIVAVHVAEHWKKRMKRRP